MAILSSPVQGLPYPDQNEKLNTVDEYIRNLAFALEKKLFMVFESAADRDAKIGTPAEGMVAYLKDVNAAHVRTDTAWKQIYPASPTIYTGTATPAASLGAVGDIYVQHI
jgi:hypothetical protein